MTEDPMPPFEEPLLDIDEIQGNTLPGFMKPHMRLISLTFGDVAEARVFLASRDVTSLADAMHSRKKVRDKRTLQPSLQRLGTVPDDVDDLWLNAALSYQGLMKLAGDSRSRKAEVELFDDEAFKLGLAARSAGLGDPVDKSAEGNPATWVVGGPGNEADVLLVLAADDPDRLQSAARHQCREAKEHDLRVLSEDSGAKLDKLGSEHFGFQDGISQPGVRGRVSEKEFLSRRMVETIPDQWLYGLPGQFLVWPGEFVFGYPASSADPLVPGRVRQDGPSWSRNGSYLVYRRLRQDVNGFWEFIATQAKRLATQPGFENWSADRLGAALVGRWKSGAPLLRAPHKDDPALGRNRLANNLFGYAKAAEPVVLVDGKLMTGPWPQAVADPVGLVCPQAAHIRKVHTRETANDMGASRASLERRILRRGLPYGARLPDEGPDPEKGDRGLLFVSYQASIERQFEFLNRWMGSPVNPRSPSGHDLLVGQNGHPGENRGRRCAVFSPQAGGGPVSAQIVSDQDFVVPTGGGYFFSPSISALRDILGAQP
jgi:Dyp-type peroxidase family